MATLNRNKSGILKLSFNQDHDCFTCSMDTGMRIYNVEPLVVKEQMKKEDFGTYAHCEMLRRSSLLAIVGGGYTPKYADNTVLIWDSILNCFAKEITFPDVVLNVQLGKDKLLVVLIDHVYVYSFPDLKVCVYNVDTCDNIKGICDMSAHVNYDRQLLVFPGRKKGSVQLVDLQLTEQSASSSPVTIPAHQTEIACLALNQPATMLATASAKGTLIRIFDTKKLVRLHEFRRGTDAATVYCINFKLDSEFLCCSSDKGTVHIFALKDINLNRKSTLSKMGFLGTYVDSIWGLTNFTVAAECACICAFGPRNSVYAVCVDGTFHKYVFNTDGNCNREIYDAFLDYSYDEDF